MPPKERQRATTCQDSHYETDLDDIELRPFERLMLNKLDRLDFSLKNISETVSKITNHVLKKTDTTGIIDVLKDTNKDSTSAIKEMTDTMKTVLKQNERTTNNQPQSLQVGSTQILLEQESQKIKQSEIEKWNQNLTKRSTEFWQQIRNKIRLKSMRHGKIMHHLKLQMQVIEGETLIQTQRSEKKTTSYLLFPNRYRTSGT